MLERENWGILPPGVVARSRCVVRPNYALLPPEGILASALPGFAGTLVRMQTAPSMGARFAQCLLEIDPGGGTTALRDDGLEHVFYLLGGALELTIGAETHHLAPGGYGFVPTGTAYALHASSADGARVIWIKRPYEAIGLPTPQPIVGKRDDLTRNAPHTPGRYWQYLLPTDDLAFDMHVNILGFAPGTYFPYVETHIMEHGLYMLEGQGVYLLGEKQYEVEPNDFIWMGSYCPQFFWCTGWGEAAYLLYKDVNRDIRFE